MDKETKANEFVRARYLFSNEQCRQVPIGLVLIAEQNHIHEILTNLTRSPKLRFQITQVQVHHVRNIHSDGTAPDSKPDSKPGGRPPGGQVVGGHGVGGQGGVGQQHTGESDANLVEVCVYGIASLYERYWEKKEPEKSKGTTPSKDPPPAQPKPSPAGKQ